jgi:glycosyltransferase involved in cell wall biosynthesis
MRHHQYALAAEYPCEMNILYLAPTPFFSVRGAPLVTYDTIKHLTARGHTVDLLTFPFGEDRELSGLTIHRCGRWLPIRKVPFGASSAKAALDCAIFLHLMWRLVLGRFGFGTTYQCIFALDESAFSCWALRWILPCPVIYDMDASIVEQFEARPGFRKFAGLGKFAETRCIRVSRVVIPQCQSYADRVSRIDPKKKIVVVPDLPLVTADQIDSVSKLAKVSELQLESPVFLYVGNLGIHQGVDLLVDAFEILNRDGLGGSLVIAGGQQAEIERFLPAHPAVHFLGIVEPDDLPAVYRVADVVVAPRRSGTNTPMKIFDYMHSGRTIVATNLETHTQVLGEDCAILVEPSSQGLAAGMIRAATDHQAALDLSRKARRKVAALTSPEIFRDRLDAALDAAVAEARSSS